MMESPFLTHRHILLNGYGAAITLRGITLSLWNGRNWPADMRNVAGLDDQHFAIAQELLAWYRQYGENDPDFMATGRDCEAIALDEKKQAEKQKAYDGWEQRVILVLRRNGKSADLTLDNYEWFFSRFEQGITPELAVEQAISHGFE
ncbi:TPA: hypothetical protein ACVBCY_003887 [Aeromonas hydrophila]